VTALAGIWSFGGRLHPDESCRRMLAAQAIYGPHGARQWSDECLAMGRRLFRTLPEDLHDRQPLHSASGRLTLVADVRLDNRDDLARALDLAPRGAGAMCDAAVLLAALECWGERALDRVVGDFAFALWNSAERSLLLARDVLGQRPLHYHRAGGFFAFASMPKGLHALPEVPYGPDEQAIAEFVMLLPPGGARSFFAGIEVLEAGHVATVTPHGFAARRYWQPARPDAGRRPAADYVEGLRHHLDQATRSRLRGANGAVATHLSAGFDSSAVTATAARLSADAGGNVVAFTAGPREDYDLPVPRHRLANEGPLAAATAARYPNIEHFVIRSGLRSPLENLDRDFLLYDRPLLNLCNGVWVSAINTAAQERKLTVLLTGQMGNATISYGGSEFLAELAHRGRLVRLGQVGAQLRATGTMSWTGVLATAFGAFAPPRVWQWLSERREGKQGFSDYTAIRGDRVETLDLHRVARERQLDFSRRPRSDGFDARLWVMRRADPGNYNKGILAGWGLDQRDPTADRRLIEYCLSVPMDQYLRNGELRSLGRRALSDRLPAAVLAERHRGYQAADWHEGLSAARGGVAEEVARLAPCVPAARVLDIDRMRRLVADWPDSGWERREVMNAYRLALLRGVSAGHFLRRAAGSNR
jgi:asparagine synthase (glutamine-hydrolysing)